MSLMWQNCSWCMQHFCLQCPMVHSPDKGWQTPQGKLGIALKYAIALMYSITAILVSTSVIFYSHIFFSGFHHSPHIYLVICLVISSWFLFYFILVSLPLFCYVCVLMTTIIFIARFLWYFMLMVLCLTVVQDWCVHVLQGLNCFTH